MALGVADQFDDEEALVHRAEEILEPRLGGSEVRFAAAQLRPRISQRTGDRIHLSRRAQRSRDGLAAQELPARLLQRQDGSADAPRQQARAADRQQQEQHGTERDYANVVPRLA